MVTLDVRVAGNWSASLFDLTGFLGAPFNGQMSLARAWQSREGNAVWGLHLGSGADARSMRRPEARLPLLIRPSPIFSI